MSVARYDVEKIRALGASLFHASETSRAQRHRLVIIADCVRIEIANGAAGKHFLPGRDLTLNSLLNQVESLICDIDTFSSRAENLASDVYQAGENAEKFEMLTQSVMHQRHSQNTSLLSSASFIAILRVLAGDVDLITAGIVAGPLGILWQLSFGKPGPDFTASVIAAATRGFQGASRDLSVNRLSTQSVSAPISLAEMATRVPAAQHGSAQVVIERYSNASETTWVVFYGGTIDMKLPAMTEPWDLRSNLEAMANTPSDSIRAAEVAAERAGVQHGDRVVHVGFSQGGLIAAQIAAKAPPNTASLVTFGAPVGHLELSSLRGAISVEHTEDLVPALSGSRTLSRGDRHTILASADLGLSQHEPFPAHQIARYAQTTERAERFPRHELDVAKAKIFEGITGDAESSWWHAERALKR